MSLEKLRPSFTFTEDRLRELQAVVPEAFADGKLIVRDNTVMKCLDLRE